MQLLFETFRSYFIFKYKREFINSTSAFQINDARQLPIIIPTSFQIKTFQNIFEKALELKGQPEKANELHNLEIILNKQVSEIYGI